MGDQIMSDRVLAWKNAARPIPSNEWKYNNIGLSFKIPDLDLTIEGMVVWDHEASEYVFQFRRHLSTLSIFGMQEGFAMYPKDVHQYLLNTFRVNFGIFEVNGMYPIPDGDSFFYNKNGTMVC